MSLRKPTILVPTRSDTNRSVQPQKQARSLKFLIYIEEGRFYLCSENKGASQLCGCWTADLRVCFRLCRLLVFPCGGSYTNAQYNRKIYMQITMTVGNMLMDCTLFCVWHLILFIFTICTCMYV